MSRRTWAIAVGFVAALLLAGVLVPRVPELYYVHRVPWDELFYDWTWTRPRRTWFVGAERIDLPPDITLWWLVALEELAVVLLGGTALAASIRRDRRARDTHDARR